MSIDTRISKLESSVRRQRWVSAILASILVFSVCASALDQRPPPEVVRTGKVEIVDASGKTFASLETHRVHGGTLRLYSRNNRQPA